MHSDTSAAEEIRTLTFDDLPLAPFIKETIKNIGYTHPTPIQAQSIPLVCEGRDLIGLAQTGTGKTAAFVLPILQKLSGSKEKGAKALILAPTRELAEQINDVIKELSPRTGLKSVTIYGGMSHGRQISDLRGKPQIVVACPGRLLDHMSGRTIDLSGVEYLVLDEADRMCDMGFLPDIKKIISKLPTERQTLLFSATMPSEIRDLTKGILVDPATVQVKIEEANTSVAHSMYQVPQSSKPAVLSHWLSENREALVVVFTKMKHTAKRLAEQLARRGQHVTSLHGNLSQGKRQHALSGFKDGRYRILIATDIAARGIDVKGITHVVNYDMPENLDAYIHRTGRAGRASATGDAVSFVTRADTSLLRSIERWLKSPMERLELPKIDGVGEESLDEAPQERRRARPGRNAQRGRPGRRERAQRDRSPERELGVSDVLEMVKGGAQEESQAQAGDAPRGRDRAPRQGRGRNERSDNRRPRGSSPRGRFNDSRPSRGPRRDDRSERSFERGPRYAYGPEADAFPRRPRGESEGSDRQDRGQGRFRGRSNERFGGQGPRRRGPRDGAPRDGGRFGRDRGDRQQQRQRGAPRDRFQSMEGPDLSQVDALKVLEKRDRPGNGNRPPRGGGNRRPGRGSFGGGDRPQRRGGRFGNDARRSRDR